MSTDFSTEKILKTIVKIAAVALTSPATIQVAGSLYPAQPEWQVIVSIAALVLVEGCLMLGWVMLDNSGPTATNGQRGLYAGLVIAAYVALWVVAIVHGEGAAGIVFRLTLAVMLAYSILESGILANVKLQARMDRDINKHPKVRKYRRSAEIVVAKSEIDLWRESELESHQFEAEYNSKERRLQHREALHFIEGQHSENGTTKRGSYSYPVKWINSRRKLRKAERLEQFGAMIAENPGLSPTEFVERAAAAFGVSNTTAWSDWAELKPEYSRNGHK